MSKRSRVTYGPARRDNNEDSKSENLIVATLDPNVRFIDLDRYDTFIILSLSLSPSLSLSLRKIVNN
jgi:hypothetical protein